jgi:hypothetical protein
MESFGGVLHGQLGLFVAAQVVFLSVVGGGDAVSVRGLLVKFGCYPVCIVWHGIASHFPFYRGSQGGLGFDGE